MMSDAADNLGYAAAVDAYLQAGWIGVLPMERGSKIWPPTIKCPAGRARAPGHNKDTCTECISYTGHRGINPSGADIAAWRDQFASGNLCLRTPNNERIAVVGIDVDAYGIKTGAKALAEAVRRWGPLPESPRSTSRDNDFISGIRLFRIPPGTVLADKINFPELGIGDIELCQYHHRYVIAWPSIHPEGGQYWWRNDANQLIGIPTIDELPWLPPRWIDGLRRTPIDLSGDAGFDVRPTLTPSEPSITVQARVQQAIKELNLPGTSRHDTTRKHVLALMRMGKSGEPGVHKSLQLLCDVFVAATSVDHSRTPDAARAEFVRMVTGETAARELSRPGLLDWFHNLANDSTPSPGGLSEGVEAGANTQTPGSVIVDDSAPRSALENIEQGFWDSRESLRMVYTTAMARMCPPWAVLAHVAARGLTQVRPHVTLPPLIGGKGSLNWFAAVVAASGGGKGASAACAELLIPSHVETRNVGSGEGMTRAFRAKPSDENPDGRREAIMFTADEVDTLAALNQRTASTTLSILRSAFSGETLGFAYADAEKSRHVPAHGYRLTFVVSVQPTRAGWLLADEGGGTPQRFMWFPGTDSRISRNRPWESGPLSLPHPIEWATPREIRIPEQAADLILDERVKAMCGDQTALDGHALFCREKFAFALTILDGRVDMTLEDWELAGIAADVSAFTRESVIAAVEESAAAEAVDRGEARGIELAAAEVAKANEATERGRRIVRWLVTAIENAGPEGITKGILQSKMNRRDRRYLDPALGRAVNDGLVYQIEGTVRWARRR